jgi:hypothetical protein
VNSSPRNLQAELQQLSAIHQAALAQKLSDTAAAYTAIADARESQTVGGFPGAKAGEPDIDLPRSSEWYVLVLFFMHSIRYNASAGSVIRNGDNVPFVPGFPRELVKAMAPAGCLLVNFRNYWNFI